MKRFSSLPCPALLFSVLAIFSANILPTADAQIALRLSDTTAAPVTVQSADITTEVTGRLAVTTFDLVFANPNDRELEGTFEFPLLDGQRVARFALDINGALREAVPVEKEKGRVVFEEIEQRRVDPGLLEQTAGNNYRARIFPIPAKGTRRIVIAYQEDLATRSNVKLAMAPRYQLALDFPNPLKTFSLTVKTFSASGTKPAKPATTLPLNLPAWSEGRMISVKKENFTARGLFELELPGVNPGNSSVLTETFNGREYFYAEAALPAMVINRPKPRPAPKTVGILWDASGSGGARDHEREIALLDAWFATVRNVDVKLVCLRDTADAPVSFKVSGGKWAGLRAALEKTTYDGATSFDGLADDAAVDEWLLFSDGLINFGTTQDIEKLPLRAPVHTLNASARAAPALLRRLAARGGGEFADLLALDAKTAAARLRQYSTRVIAVERDPEALAQVFPEAGAPVNNESGALVVTGILRKPSATVRVTIGTSEKDARTFDVAVKSGAGASTLAARAWAMAKIEHLVSTPGDNREDIRRTSREFRIVTPDTSLIVLETLGDYVRYDIEPPAEESELRAQWSKQIQRKKSRTEVTPEIKKEYREELLESFKEQTAWWGKEFPKDAPAPPKPKEPKAETPDANFRMRDLSASVATEQPARPVPTATISANTTGNTTGNQTAPTVLYNVDPDSARATLTVKAAPLSQIQTPQIPVLKDTAASISVFTTEFLNDIGASSMDEMLSNAANVAAGDDVIELSPFCVTGDSTQQSARITLKRWDPKADYLDRLRRAPASERYAVYVEARAEHAKEPGFFVDVADFFFNEAGDKPAALRILSNLAELGLEDAALLRVLGYRLVQAGRHELALPVFERVLKIRGEEPQSRRDLALVCARLGQFQRAIDLLWETAERPWDGNFDGIGIIALNEMNAIIATCGQKLDLSKIDPRLLKNLPVGLRVALTWDANNCDIDLWVDDPIGERADYSNRETYQGGHMSEDFTRGYGPEVFMLRKPKPGKYTVHINYYGESAATALGPVTAQVRLITGFGTPQEKEELITVRLVDKKDSLEIGSIEIGK